MTPTTAILITNYNNAPWLRACLDSALAQTRPADEIIVYDDDSSDESREILRSYGERLRWLAGPARPEPRPLGLICQTEGIARALAASTADLVSMLDGDDCYLPGRIETAVKAWEKRPEACLVQGPIREIDEAGVPRVEWRYPRPAGDDYLGAVLRSHDVWWFYPTSAQLFRRDFLERHLPMELPNRLDCAIDMRLAYLAALSPGGVSAYDEVATLYRRREVSMGARTGYHARSRAEINRMHIRCFNAYAEAAGRGRVNPWRNRRYVLQRVRAWLPRALGDRLAEWKARRELAARGAVDSAGKSGPR